MHFRAPQRRQQAFAGRALLWHALTKYAPEKAAAMTLRQRAGSKPTLFENSGPAGIQFSLAHSASMVLCAFSRTAALGVDIERIRPRPHLHKIAARMFTKHEQAAIEKLPFAEQTAAFFRCWNSKEAYLKASGALNLFQLSDVETISVASARNPWQHSYGEGESPHTWSFYSFEPWPGFSAACAVEGVPSAWRFWIATL